MSLNQTTDNNIHFKREGIDRQSRLYQSPLDRRSFLKLAGFGALSLSAAGWIWPVVTRAEDSIVSPDHYVPLDKQLDPGWVQALIARGRRTVYTGKDLDTIGMPVGGVCAGQVYLTGDGRLSEWQIFNQLVFSGYGQTNYQLGRRPDLCIDQGVAIRIQNGDKQMIRTIDRRGFEDVRFCGEYPIGMVRYRDKGVPVDVELEAFSPFIPLNAADSALPATILRYTLQNHSDLTLQITLAGWLDNQVNRFSGQELPGLRSTDIQTGNRVTTMLCRAKHAKVDPVKRDTIIFADFEGQDYSPWKVEGEAFGKGPAHGTLESQQQVTGFQGKGLVNTYLGGNDQLQGKLISPDFTIERDFINMLVGGGAHTNKTCVNLIIDGKVIRTAKGNNTEKLSWQNWNVREFMGKKAHIEIVDTESKGWGHINVDQIEFSDTTRSGYGGKVEEQIDHGTMALSVLGDDGIVTSRSLPDGPADQVMFLGEGLAQTKDLEKPFGLPLRGAAGKTFTLKPDAKETVTLIVSWHFPKQMRDANLVGHFYDNQFSDAAQVARYISIHEDRLVGQTKLWHDTYYDSTLPWWLLDRLGSTLSTLASGTCQWWKNGRFWAWEGVGCCHGTCAHVWNYEHAMARLFPRLERSVREMQDYAIGAGFVPETGMVRFRGEGWGMWAADSQAGGIMKAYREHQMSADSEFLKRNWAHIKKALQFLINEDANEDGFLEGKQHNTFDIDFYGPNPMIVSLYLGALRAGQEMAIELGDKEFAGKCKAIYDRGSKNFVEKLFNGEYFIQIVDHKKHPDAQYGDGCLSDQLFGQGWAHQVGLGYIVPKKYCKTTLRSVWKYNWAPDVETQNKSHAPERWFAYPGEAGLFTCTWPKSPHMGKKSVRYRNEVWTGIEYQVAGNMAWEGMTTEALAICRGIHERYHPGKHNPWNEIECGDHYARGMASWGILTGLCGFEYHGPKRHIGFAPRIQQEQFQAAFTGAQGWGTLTQSRKDNEQTNGIKLVWGSLPIKSISTELPEGVKAANIKISSPRQVRTDLHQEGTRLTVTFDKEIDLKPGQELTITCNI
ncbi:MAG: hypothetical protein JXA82_02755 [Sedimentisphaerales bacterium]|nr:hypothetical protein [Sedimentisphaerales bacterium]